MKAGLAGIGAAFAAAAALAPDQAVAGAWPHEEQAIVGAGIGREAGAALYETSVYWERTLGGDLGIVAQGYGAGGPAYAGSWNGEGLLAGKWSIVNNGGRALALQAGMTYLEDNLSACGGVGGEIRVLGGASLGSAFVDVQAAHREQDDGCAHARLDATLGWRPSPNWLGLAQVFADRDFSNEQTVKTQISLARFIDDGIGVQIGLRARTDRGRAEDPALLVGLWRTR